MKFNLNIKYINCLSTIESGHIRYLILIYFSIFSAVINAQVKITNGVDLIDTDNIKHLRVNNQYGHIEKSKNKSGNWQIEFQTHTEPKFSYNCSSIIPITPKNFKKGTVFLLSFKAKTERASLETGEAKAKFILKQTQDHDDIKSYTQSFSSNWQSYYLPFKLDKFVNKEVLKLLIHYGYSPQSFLIKDLKFEVFPFGTNVRELPKTKIVYEGMEPDAEWRIKANQRIEILRKRDFMLQFLKNGNPLANKIINIKLVKHAFPFGTAISAKDVINTTNVYKNAKKAFSSMVLANDLKIKQWKHQDKRAKTIKALNILNQEGYSVKGHVLVWPGFKHLTEAFYTKREKPKKILEMLNKHVNDILENTKGKITHWDVVNEAYTNKDLQNITGGEDILYETFRILAQKQPKVRRFTNEYGIISKGGIDTQKQEWYYNFIKRIDENTNNLVQGIGIQSHIGSALTPPKRVLEILSYYSTLGKQISISEFTMDIQEPKIREQYTRDFMIASFSHPNVCEFLFWGGTEDGRKKCDIFTKENEVGVMGKAYFSLVNDEWSTNITARSSQQGIVENRGFFGVYEYTFVEHNKVRKGTFEVKRRRSNAVIKIEI